MKKNIYESLACPVMAIAVDSEGNSYVTGRTNSGSFPTTPGAIDATFNVGGTDAFVTKLNATGSALIYSTFLGSNSSGTEEGLGIAVNAAGNAVVTGPVVATSLLAG